MPSLSHFDRPAAPRRWPMAAVAAAFAVPGFADAQGVATDTELAPVTVSASRSALDPNLPNSTASLDAEALRAQSLFNAEDAARLLPGTTVRKRYLGDRNANVGGRSFGVLQPGRALVYLDGYLISNFLGRFDAPRWNMVNLEAVERIDALYGPFSALYPGNSIGTTLVLTERRPRGFEASASLRVAHQDFAEYAARESLTSSQVSARLADRHANGLWWTLGLQHQDSQGQPMGYGNAVRGVGTGLQPPGSQRPVTGLVFDRDPQGRERVLYGANGLDHSRQDTVNARVGFAPTPQQALEARVALWRSDSTVRATSWLTDAGGATVWSGPVRDDRVGFTIPASTFAPSTRAEAHRQLGATWKTAHADGWNASVVATAYRITGDDARQADGPPPAADAGGPGSVTRRDGTGWDTLELQATWRPAADGDGPLQRHALTLGLHHNRYVLDQRVDRSSDWRGVDTGPDQRYAGRTRITAAYAQDAWRFADAWRLTTGLRWERFQADGGRQSFTGPPAVALDYPSRTLQAFSPKLSLAWAATDAWLLKASAGRGVRFPNVDELYNGTRTGTSITTSDPALRPERSDALELSAEWSGERGQVRASLFRDDVADTIVRQTDATVVPAVTRVSNVDRVLTDGVELAFDLRDVGVQGLALRGSATWARATIEANAASPATVDRRWLRIPPQRYTLQADWRPRDAWLASATWRFSGRQFNTDTNADVFGDVFGGTSRVNQLDLKLGWRFAPGWEWSVGVDNVTDRTAWQVHTLPQRMWHTALRWETR